MNPSHDLTIPTSALTTRIALLAMLSLRPMHGYELRQMLEERHLHRWANIQYGSIYRGLQQMAREGLLSEDGEEREGNRPPRMIYRVTDAGRRELETLLRQAWTKPTLTAEPVDLSLSLFRLLPQEEIVSLVEQRLKALDSLEQTINAAQAQFEGNFAGKPEAIQAVVGDLFLHRRRLLAAEREWTEYILTRLYSGAYRFESEEQKHCHPQPKTHE